jgi:ribonuclease T2
MAGARTRSWTRLALAFLLLPMLAGVASAQGERRGGAPGSFDFYVLALSWSPGFCATEGDGKGRDQCRAGAGLGFVVHGLWPQFARGFPSDCQPANPTPSRLSLEAARGVFPDEGLARYEWRKHGTCSGRSPTDYFRDVRAARDSVKIPPEFSSPSAPLTTTAIDLERSFVAANPGLRADMLSVGCRGSVLQEVRICLSRDLRGFTSCPEVDRRGCRARDITVPAVR